MAFVANDSDEIPVTEIMTRDPVCGHADTPVEVLVRTMIERHIGCIPIVDERRRPRGIVTKSDLTELLERSLRVPFAVIDRTAADVMMPLAICLDERATVAHAARMMQLEDMHHVLIASRAGQLVGVVSAKDIVTWLANA
jgi:CBS domain-containing protein